MCYLSSSDTRKELDNSDTNVGLLIYNLKLKSGNNDFLTANFTK